MSRSAGVGSYVTEDVRRFLLEFREAIRSGKPGLVWDCIAQFEAITEETYQVSQWPKGKAVAASLGLKPDTLREDYVFLTIYSELQHRHTFERCDVFDSQMLDNFKEAWDTYIALFALLIRDDGVMPEMSSAWLWDVINGFGNHFQFWHYWKAQTANAAYLIKEGKRGGKEVKLHIQSCWNIQTVLRYLQVGVARAGGLPLRFNPPLESTSSVSQFKRLLGLFGLTALLRVNVLTCDYSSALECMDSVDLRKKSPLTHNVLCVLTSRYYLAFAFLMSKRWMDAHNTLASVLCRVQPPRRRRRVDEEELTAFDIYAEKYLRVDALVNKCYALLAIVEALCPQYMDKALVGDYLTQKQGPAIERMRGGTAIIREESARQLFITGAPDFVNVCDLWADTGEYNLSESDADFAHKVAKEQFEVFWRLAKRRDVCVYKEELRLYRTIPLEKLAVEMATLHTDTFNLLAKRDAVVSAKDDEKLDDSKLVASTGATLAELTAEAEGGVDSKEAAKVKVNLSKEEFQKQLLQLKCAMKQFRRAETFGFGTSEYSKGAWVNDAAFDFEVVDGIVHVNDAKEEGAKLHRYSTNFLRQIRTIQECMEQFSFS